LAERVKSMDGPLIPEIVEPDESLPADLVALRRLAWLLDAAVAIPGTRRRIGISAAIGFVPGVGDAIGGFLSAWIIFGAFRHRVPTPKLLRMIANVVVDVLVGSVPIVGDIADILFKENIGNVEILVRTRDRSRPPRSTAHLVLAIMILFGFFAILGLLAIMIAIGVIAWLLADRSLV
jgi:hypothetical protein